MKKALSVFLSLILVFSAFSVLPFSANAYNPDLADRTVSATATVDRYYTTLYITTDYASEYDYVTIECNGETYNGCLYNGYEECKLDRLEAGDYTATVTLTDNNGVYNEAQCSVSFTVDTLNKAGNNVLWTYDEDTETLTLSGTGNTYDSDNNTDYSPFYDFEYPIRNLVVEEGITSIGRYMFYWCEELKTVSLPSTLETICDYAFEDCTGLDFIQLPEGLKTIGYDAFEECFALTDVVIPSTVTTLEGGAFFSCHNLKSVTFLSGITNINYLTFQGCESLETVYVPKSLTTIGTGAFYAINHPFDVYYAGTESEKGSMSIESYGNLNDDFINATWHYNTQLNKCGDNAYYIFSDDGKTLFITGTGDTYDYNVNSNKSAFYWNQTVENIYIANGITGIGDYIFDGCTKVKSISLPSSVAKIGRGAFYQCRGLEAVSIPDTLSVIEGEAFGDCQKLSDITLPNALTELGASAFHDCLELTEISIPAGVTEIKEGTFFKCDNLVNVYIDKSITAVGNSSFDYCDSLTDVWYTGSQADKGAMQFGTDNTKLENATWHYGYVPSLSGIGTKASPYLINDYEGLKEYSQLVLKGRNGTHAALINDITATDKEWIPIGLSRYDGNAFMGEIDGRFHIISGLSNADVANIQGDIGLFGYAYDFAVIKNVAVDDVDFRVANKEYDNIGGIAGYGKNAEIINCVNLSDIDGEARHVGGIVGEATYYLKISNCYNEGDISCRGQNYALAGGIIGSFDMCTISNCYNTGNISATSNDKSYAGGISGDMWYMYNEVTGCYSTGTVEASSPTTFVGALFGENGDSDDAISNSYYNSTIETDADAVGSGNCGANVAGLTTEQFKVMSNFKGFDDSVWYMGAERPLLEVFKSTVSFDANNGSGTMAAQNCVWNETVTLNENEYTRAHYDFAGWNTKQDGTGDPYGDKDTYSVRGDLTLYAQWDEHAKYAVSFVDEDGTSVLQSGEWYVNETPVYSGETPTKAATAQYTFTFNKWDNDIVPVTGTATYTATYSSTVNEYTIRFVNEDGTELQNSLVAYDETPAYTGETPTKAADDKYTYEFDGWDAEITAVSGEATYTATYKAIEIPVYTSQYGAILQWTKGSNEALVITIKRSYNDNECFTHYLRTLIDGKVVAVPAHSGSTVITLDAATLEALSVGNHTVTAEFDDGTAEIPLQINAAASPEAPAKDNEIKSPETGNDFNLLFILLPIAALTLTIAAKPRSKKEER